MIAAAVAVAAAALLVTADAAPTKPAQPTHLKVLVLDVNSAELTASEKVTLANLEAAHLSEEPRLEVLSGEDIKQLVALQGQAQEIGVNGNCTDACMAELAGALGAGVVVSTQAGRLGDTIVVSLAVFDAAKAKSVSRKSVTATSLGELPAKLGPALDALIQPLLPQRFAAATSATTATPITTTATPATTTSTRGPMTGRVKELYDAESISICVDQNDRAAWWFCDAKAGYTENAFVRKYRDVVGAHDLDRADQNRDPGGWVAPLALGGLAVVGGGVLAATLLCGVDARNCGSDAHDFFDPDGPDPAPLGFIGGLLVGVGGSVGGVAGAVSTIPWDGAASEGTPQMHTLTEGEGRAAAARFNDALRDKLARDLGESG